MYNQTICFHLTQKNVIPSRALVAATSRARSSAVVQRSSGPRLCRPSAPSVLYSRSKRVLRCKSSSDGRGSEWPVRRMRAVPLGKDSCSLRRRSLNAANANATESSAESADGGGECVFPGGGVATQTRLAESQSGDSQPCTLASSIILPKTKSWLGTRSARPLVTYKWL